MALLAYAFTGAAIAVTILAGVMIPFALACWAGDLAGKFTHSFEVNIAVTCFVLIAETGFIFGYLDYLLRVAA